MSERYVYVCAHELGEVPQCACFCKPAFLFLSARAGCWAPPLPLALAPWNFRNPPLPRSPAPSACIHVIRDHAVATTVQAALVLSLSRIQLAAQQGAPSDGPKRCVLQEQRFLPPPLLRAPSTTRLYTCTRVYAHPYADTRPRNCLCTYARTHSCTHAHLHAHTRGL
jgi:hypothetical protein